MSRAYAEFLVRIARQYLMPSHRLLSVDRRSVQWSPDLDSPQVDCPKTWPTCSVNSRNSPMVCALSFIGCPAVTLTVLSLTVAARVIMTARGWRTTAAHSTTKTSGVLGIPYQSRGPNRSRGPGGGGTGDTVPPQQSSKPLMVGHVALK